MLTDALALAEQAATMGQAERLTWGIVELQVTDLDRAVAFWTSTLGLRVRDQSDLKVALGTKTQTLFVLRSGATAPISHHYLGLYHVALGVPDALEFHRLWARLIALGVTVAPVDHLMSKSIYFTDPDGLAIEIALETPERFGSFGDMSQNLVLYDSDGRTHDGRERLHAGPEVHKVPDSNLNAPLSEEAFVSHLHLRVAALDLAVAWFRAIGFEKNLLLPEFGMADMGAGSAYTHRLAMNIWSGENLPPAPEYMARLTHYELHARDAAVIAAARGLKPIANGLAGRDPSGTRMTLLPAC